ncbi:DedA family protein [Actinomadura decatromicini]|uniref:DedA family protein n=1 Tax=Actinomadura decatromicini TaxID=2604572 RepID=A0A5D3F741_9ACTN|nr:DedA family protein [Actinomadura decatromicini]TYK44003.1 DedA family protein [Actinomadura decatromicini]
MFQSVVSWVSGLSGPVIYAVVAGLVFCEDALFFGFVLPGETAVVLGGALAAQHKVSVVPLAAIVVLAAIAGDFVGYQIGRHAGQPILETRPLRRHHDRVDAARDLIRRRGGVAVFVGRFVAFFRAIMPALAGVSAMPSRVFLLYNAAGGLVWGVSFTLLGYFAGHAYARIEHVAGRISAIVIAAVVVLAVVIWRLRGHPQS